MTCQTTQGAVAQLARAIRSHRIGREFESLLLHHCKFFGVNKFIDAVFFRTMYSVAEKPLLHNDFPLICVNFLLLFFGACFASFLP